LVSFLKKGTNGEKSSFVTFSGIVTNGQQIFMLHHLYFFANSYLCIRVPITGSQKSYFSISTVARSGFTGGGTHTLLGLRQKVAGHAHKKVTFLPTTCAQKNLKKMQTPLLVQKNLLDSCSL
jgi:hypothetical protein